MLFIIKSLSCCLIVLLIILQDETASVGAASSSHVLPMVNVGRAGLSGVNVLNRVGHQQDKWKKQVIEQRKNIYDRHSMLN